MVQKIWTWVSPTQVLSPNFWIYGLPASAYNAADGMHPLVLPTWLPNPLTITRARIAHQSQASRPGGQFALVIDVGLNQWNTRGVPPFTVEGDYSQLVTLVSLWDDQWEPQERTEIWEPPVVFDATKDALWAQFSIAPNVIDQFFFQIGFEA